MAFRISSMSRVPTVSEVRRIARFGRVFARGRFDSQPESEVDAFAALVSRSGFLLGEEPKSNEREALARIAVSRDLLAKADLLTLRKIITALFRDNRDNNGALARWARTPSAIHTLERLRELEPTDDGAARLGAGGLLDDVRWFSVRDAWTGLAIPAALGADLVRRAKGQFEGMVTHWIDDVVAREDIRVPAGRAREVFAMIGDAVVEESAYGPAMAWTDDYPSIRLEIHTGGHAACAGKTVVLESEAQTEGRYPWKVTVNEVTRFSNEPTITQALELLAGPLKRGKMRGRIRGWM